MPDQQTLAQSDPDIDKKMHDQSRIASSFIWRSLTPQQVLAWLPLTLFFPVGVMYGGVLVFYISLLLSGEFARKWQRIIRTPMLPPIMLLSIVSVVIGCIHDKPAEEFWSGFWHYQTYLFLLPFLSVGGGPWQKKAINIFFAGSIFAASLFYLNAAHLLPNNTLFRSYVVYQGNKSILLGILLAISAAWMLHELFLRKDYRLIRVAAFVYIVVALLVLAKTRTASLIFALLCLLMLCRNLQWSWRSAVLLLSMLLGLYGAWHYVLSLPAPSTCLVSEMKQTNPLEILVTRAECTVHQIHSFNEGKNTGEDGMRLEIYRVTGQIIAEQPWLGHGIANWMPVYQQRAKGLISGTMTTPHNDYLLYFTELGIAGVFALLWIWCTQLFVASRMRASGADRDRAMLLAMLGVTMMVGSMFNAILRDAVFGMAFMILLAIPLAGVEKSKLKRLNQ